MMADYRLEENIRRYGSKEALEAAYHKTIPQIREILMQSAREYFLTQGVQKETHCECDGNSCRGA